MAFIPIQEDKEKVTQITNEGFLLVTGGFDYVTVDGLEQSYIADVEEASSSIMVFHVEASTCPRLTQSLGCNAVPTIYHISGGEVIGSMTGVMGAEQVRAYLTTGVSPV